MEAIDRVLDGLKLHSSVFSRLEVGEGWGFAKDRLEGAPFHIVVEGEAWVGSESEDDFIRLARGDMVILPRGQPHRLVSAPHATTVRWSKVIADAGLQHFTPGDRIKPSVLRVGVEGRPCAKLISGIFEFADRRRNPLLATLPHFLVLRGAEEMPSPGARLAEIAEMINGEIEANGPGSGIVAGRLADYLFVQAVRAYLVTNTDKDPGWLRGLHHPQVGSALTLIHAQPDREWSVERLAKEVSMSRSLFAHQFKLHVGRGPIEYLTEWRMFEAAGYLNEGMLSPKEIARIAGYNSVAAFGKAFKRWAGESPATVRRASRTSRAA